MRPRLGAKALLDVVVTALVGVAAVVVIWQSWSGRTVEPSAQRPSSPPPFEDLASSELTTSIADAPTAGSANAPLVLIEYSDFECPFCATHALDTFKSIETDFLATNRVAYVFRNYPIEQIHPTAIKAAQVAGCAHRQGRFLEMRNLLFSNSRTLARMDWVGAAGDLDLDGVAFQACLAGSEVEQIRAEKEEAERLGVASTPTFFIAKRRSDGLVQVLSRKVGGAPYTVFKERLEQAIASAASSS